MDRINLGTVVDRVAFPLSDPQQLLGTLGLFDLRECQVESLVRLLTFLPRDLRQNSYGRGVFLEATAGRAPRIR